MNDQFNDEISNIIKSLFITLFNNNSQSIYYLNTLIKSYTTIIYKNLRELNYYCEHVIHNNLNKWMISIKDEIIEYTKNISNVIYNSKTPDLEYTKQYEYVNTMLQIINIVFKEIFNEIKVQNYIDNSLVLDNSNFNENLLIEFFYKEWKNNVYTTVSHKCGIIIFNKINSLREKLKDKTYYNLIKIRNMNIYELFEKIEDSHQTNNSYNHNLFNEIENYITSLNSLDESLNNTDSIIYFNSSYISYISRLYNFTNNKLEEIYDKKDRINELIKIINVESFLNYNLFENPDTYLSKLYNELIINNLDEVKNLIFQGIDNIMVNCDYIFERLINNNPQNTVLDLLNDYLTIPNLFVILDLIFKDSLKDKMYDTFIIKLLDVLYNNIKRINKRFDENNKNNEPQENIHIQFFKYYTIMFLIIEELFKIDSNDTKIIINNSNQISKYINTFNDKSICNFIIDCCSTTTKNNIDINIDYILLYVSYYLEIISNKDELELLLKITMCKKILSDDTSIDLSKFKMICKSNSNYNFSSILKSIDDYFKNKILTQEYNIVYNTKNHISSDIKILPYGISPVKQKEYNNCDYLSVCFKEFISKQKNKFNHYYKTKCENKKISWCEQLSSLDIDFPCNNYTLSLKCNYKQADLIYVLHYEYNDIILDCINKKISSYKLNKINNIFKNSKFIKFLLKINIIQTSQINIPYSNIVLEIYKYNNNIKLNKNKYYNFVKLKSEKSTSFDSKNKNNEYEKSKNVINLALERKDYINSAIMLVCKVNKNRSLDKSELKTYCAKKLINRFEVTDELLDKSINYLIDHNYIENIDNKYKYVL